MRLGRLFWKFFFFIWLTQLTTMMGVGVFIWFEHHAHQELNDQRFSPQPRFAPDHSFPDHDFPPPPHDGERHHGPPPLHFPIEPLIAGSIASLFFSWLLAWYFSKPIRSLRDAFQQLASGDLNVNVSDSMGTRKDELTDLGHDFDHMVVQLKALMDGQRRLLHDVSHELRSPLARLQAAVGLARQQPDKTASSFDRLEREAERMDQLIDELLTLSRLEAGMPAISPVPINIEEMLLGIVEDTQVETIRRDDSVVITGHCYALIQGQPEFIHRAVENVVRNALKHAGGRVEVNSKLNAEANQLIITVLDQGSGVNEDEIDQIFTPFFRGKQSTKKRAGHGLGLAIAKRIVESHHGSIRAFNRESGGFAVEISLPIA